MTAREWTIAVFDFMAGAAGMMAAIKVVPSLSAMVADIHPAWLLIITGLSLVASAKLATSK